ncbi:phenylalanine--tRNA ligase subunit beta [Patescibacteria group bacterium]|nr:phenylalanine--tRNA ligase subunit beta [Patescibacteria group bacterium]
MNLLTSYNWLREYLDCDLSPEAFAARISLSGPAVEKIIPRDAELEKIVVGKIVKVEPHPQADRLRVLQVDVGDASPLTIVCGGSNVAQDQLVAVAMLGAKVHWHGEGELVTMELTKIRGVESQGMVCAAEEIGLGTAFPKKDEKEILDLGLALPDLVGEKLRPGTPLAQVLGCEKDVLMDIEVTTNRPDAMSILGLARESGAILDLPFKGLKSQAIKPAADAKALNIKVEDAERCRRYLGVKLDGVTNGQSPWWLKERLLSAGVRPISVLVDITNYVLLELGQPLHVFDASKLEGEQIQVRQAKAKESIQALDGKTYELQPGMLVIADATKPVAVAGVMGGEATGVMSTTTSVIFEAATFDQVSVRRTARALNLYSDSQSLYEKGLSTEALPSALARAVELCLTLAGGKVTSQIFDSQTKHYVSKHFSIPLKQVRSLIGIDLPTDEMVGTLERLGFEVQVKNEILSATVPWWRDHDIEDGRDLVEEIARVHGYANLPSIFPAGISTRPSDPLLDLEDRCRTIAQGAGLTEVYSYAFVSADQLQKTGYHLDQTVRLQNPLAADLEYMRPSLLPGVLQVVADNQERVSGQGYFELANCFEKRSGTLPDEHPMLFIAMSGDDQIWKRAKGAAELLLQRFGIQSASFESLTTDSRGQWHPGRSASIIVNRQIIGTIGELHPLMASAWKLNERLGMCEIDLLALEAASRSSVSYTPIPAFPSSKRDIALVVDLTVTVEQITKAVQKTATVPVEVEWFDTYRGKGVEDGKKSLAFHLTFQSPTKTLSSEEVEVEVQKITQLLVSTLGASLRA